jgi:hypothetical protein
MKPQDIGVGSYLREKGLVLIEALVEVWWRGECVRHKRCKLDFELEQTLGSSRQDATSVKCQPHTVIMLSLGLYSISPSSSMPDYECTCSRCIHVAMLPTMTHHATSSAQ